MGMIMSDLRGKVDGQEISKLVREKLTAGGL
jgi:uncharacterized protein YqeY